MNPDVILGIELGILLTLAVQNWRKVLLGVLHVVYFMRWGTWD